ncbi:MAG TPA: Ig-like domain-containing protein, partial [Acidimicrobiales bacterium]|nr:Ig-like domain-containing protein [Acidimicrobiales bacterium]
TLRLSTLLVVAVSLIVLQLSVGTAEGVSGGAGYRSFELVGQDVIVNIDRAPDGLVTNRLATGYEPPAFIRQMIHFARSQRLSLFSTSAFAYFSKKGLVQDTAPPTTRVYKPRSGSVLDGRQWLVAAASAQFGLSRVAFYFSGNGRPETFITQATETPYGWLGAWDTETVPNGTYELESVASDSRGLTDTSPGVTVQVANKH